MTNPKSKLQKIFNHKPAQIFWQKQFQSGKPLLWTAHAQFKMRQYGLSEARVKRVLRNPVRVEAGIVQRTVAVMALAGNKKHELWVMYADTKKARRIIAAWRYPGVSPVREPPPFPEDLMGDT